MATKIYEYAYAYLVDGTELEISPLKIKYLRQFMVAFDTIQQSQDDEESLTILCKCVAIAMKQFHPSIKTLEDVEDNFDVQNIYKIIEFSAGIKMNAETTEEPVKEKAIDAKAESSWNELDLAKLEAELFQLGIWRDYDELERSLSMPELSITLELKREADYEQKKFLAAIQGVDIEAGAEEPDAWEKLKAKVANKGKDIDPNDIVSFKGQRAAEKGFGIGMGLEYQKI